MRLKEIAVNGRRLGAKDGVVLRLTGSGAVPELTFEQLETILEQMKKLVVTSRVVSEELPILTLTSAYPAVIDGIGENVILSFGCWTVGGPEMVKKVLAQLREINQYPYYKPAPGVVELPGGTCVKVHNGMIYTCSDQGDLIGAVIPLKDAEAVLANMEYRKQWAAPKIPGTVTVTGTGDQVQFVYGCQALTLDEVKKALEVLNQPQVKTEPVAS